MKNTGLDNIVIGPVEAPGIRWVNEVVGHYAVPAIVDSCHARESNEGLTKADENCHLVVDNQG
jgi:hypothetical protein